jgi:hypothetical protein
VTTRRCPRLPLRLSALFALATLATIAFAPAPLHAAPKGKAEKPYALIFGTVWGPDDRPIYGVKIKIRRAKDKKPKWELYSDHNGEFAQRVPAGEGDYILATDLKGVKTTDGAILHLAKEITVHVYYDERVDTGLHLTK